MEELGHRIEEMPRSLVAPLRGTAGFMAINRLINNINFPIMLLITVNAIDYPKMEIIIG